MWSLSELFPKNLQISVLDIGAAMDERPPYRQLMEQGQARIIGFEPDQGECDRLNREYGEPHRFFPHFIGDGKPAVFHETNWSLTGSLFEPNTPLLSKFQNLAELTQPVATHPVTTTRLDDIAEIKDVDFIKIDIQGGELSALQNGQRILSGVLAIQTEVEFVELYRQQPMFSDVDAFLRAHGFQFHAFEGIGGRAFKPLVVDGKINKGLRQCLWADAIYVRDWLDLTGLSESKLQKYALIAHDILRSYDLAHFILMEIDRRAAGSYAATYLGAMQKHIGQGDASGQA